MINLIPERFYRDLIATLRIALESDNSQRIHDAYAELISYAQPKLSAATAKEYRDAIRSYESFHATEQYENAKWQGEQ